jgi:hypothetical protein
MEHEDLNEGEHQALDNFPIETQISEEEEDEDDEEERDNEEQGGDDQRESHLDNAGKSFSHGSLMFGFHVIFAI